MYSYEYYYYRLQNCSTLNITNTSLTRNIAYRARDVATEYFVIFICTIIITTTSLSIILHTEQEA
jgi:hypothetical protein